MLKTFVIGIGTLALTLSIGGCGDGKKNEPAPPAGGSATKSEPSAPTASAVKVVLDKATAGSVKGKVMLKATPPVMKDIDFGARKAECGVGDEPAKEESVIVGEGDALANVIVTVKSGPALNVDPGPVPSDPIVLDQVHCRYVPHVIAMRAGQPMKVKSSDNTSHNVHVLTTANVEWNQTMGPKEEFMVAEDKKVKVPESPKTLRVKCDIHPWMGAFIGAYKHNYFAVTGKDGAYELKDLPPGDYEIEVWHEYPKFKSAPQKVTVGAKETKELNFEFK